MKYKVFQKCKKCLQFHLNYYTIVNVPTRRKRLLWLWLVGQEAKTLPSHGRIVGSIPARAMRYTVQSLMTVLFFLAFFRHGHLSRGFI